MTHQDFVRFWILLKEPRERLDEKFAELTSPCPVLSKRISVPTESAYDSLIYVILVKLYTPLRTEYFKGLFFEHIMRTAQNNHFSGKWQIVKEILQTNILTEEKMFWLLSKYFSKEDLFGNLVPAMIRLSKAIHIRKLQNNRPVRKPRRKRGYDDKGSLLPQHQKHSAWTFKGPNPIKEPEEEIWRPLLSQEWLVGTKESGGSGGNQTLPKKERIDQHEKPSDRTSNSSARGENRSSTQTERVPQKFNRRERFYQVVGSYCLAVRNKRIELWELYLYSLMLENKDLSNYGKYPSRLKKLRESLTSEQHSLLNQLDRDFERSIRRILHPEQN